MFLIKNLIFNIKIRMLEMAFVIEGMKEVVYK